MKPAEKWPSIPDTVFTSTPFCRARVAKVCRKSWNRTLGNPARFSTRWSICSTLSGEMGPPLGDGNTQGLLPTEVVNMALSWYTDYKKRGEQCGQVQTLYLGHKESQSFCDCCKSHPARSGGLMLRSPMADRLDQPLHHIQRL